MSNLGLQFSFFTNPSQLCYLGRLKLLEFFGRFKVPWSSDGVPSIFEGCQGTPDMALRLRDSVGELPAEMLVAMKEVEQGVRKAPGRHQDFRDLGRSGQGKSKIGGRDSKIEFN